MVRDKLKYIRAETYVRKSHMLSWICAYDWRRELAGLLDLSLTLD